MGSAPDLVHQQPRPLEAELDGYAWLPRMFDKARATAAGTQGTYLFGCPVDHTCMARLGISPELVLELLAREDDDAAVLDELRRRGIPSAADAWFDAPAVEDELQTDVYLRVRQAAALPGDANNRLFTGVDHGAAVSVAIVELAPGSGQAAHVHPTEEVTVVCDGEATVFLGERQARIVRAGEVVRIPAGIPHCCLNTGALPVRAVAAYGAATIVTEPATSAPATSRPATSRPATSRPAASRPSERQPASM
jgi:quercetin dioxygenase-like cupin family protein